MAFRYERQIRGALENAPDLTENTLDDVSEWRALPDDALVTFGRTKNILKAAPNQIVVPNTSSLWRVYKELEVMGLGYAGDAQEIGDRIRLFNRDVSSREELPIPLSYRRK